MQSKLLKNTSDLQGRGTTEDMRKGRSAPDVGFVVSARRGAAVGGRRLR